MGGPRRALVGLGIAGLAAGAAFAAVTLGSRHTGDRALAAALGLLVGWAFVGTGLFAWWRRPANRSGALMAGIGFAWFAAGLSAANASLPYTIGIAVDGVFAAMLGHLLLGFPDGRLAEPAARAVQAAIYATVTVLQVPALLFQPGEPGGPRNLMMVRADPGLSDALDTGQLAVAIALVVASLGLLARRWGGRGSARRRGLGPVLVTAAVTIVLFLAAKVAEDVLGAPHGALDALTLLAFAAVPFAFLAGLLGARLAGADAVRALVARVGQAPDPEALRGALAAALRDPTVALAYWLPESGRFADAAGRPVAVPAAGDGRAWTVVEHDGRRVGAIEHDAALTEDDPGLVRAVGAAVALALENQRLQAELRAQIEELRTSRARLVEVGDRERRRLERDLHDGAQQRLVSLLLTLKLDRRALPGGAGPAGPLLDRVEADLAESLAELRRLARGILPPVLGDRGLGAALDDLAGRAPVPVEVVREPARRLPEPVEIAAYFVVAEALTNVAKYARATHATVAVDHAGDRAVIEVRDDGVGGADPGRGSGLRGLDDRMAAAGGTLTIVSEPGAGTLLRAEIPCAS
jgi:signal transduction histidine kinase